MKDPYAEYNVDKRSWIPQMHRRSISIFNQNYNTPGNFRQGLESRDSVEFLPYDEEQQEDQGITDEYLPNDEGNEIDESTVQDFRMFFPVMRLLNKMKQVPRNPEEDYTYRPTDVLRDFEETERDQDVDVVDFLRNNILGNAIKQNNEEIVDDDYPRRFTFVYNTPDNFRAGWEIRDLLNDDDGMEENEEIPESRIYFDEGLPQNNPIEEYGSGSHNQQDEIFRELKNENNFLKNDNEQREEIFRELKNMQNDDNYFDVNGPVISERKSNLHQQKEQQKEQQQQQPGFYAEGGLLYIPKRVTNNESNKFTISLM